MFELKNFSLQKIRRSDVYFYYLKVIVPVFCCRAVVDHSLGKDLPNVSVESFENLPGRGLYATLSSIEVISCIFLIGKLIPKNM